jgi:hypothetical protein
LRTEWATVFNGRPTLLTEVLHSFEASAQQSGEQATHGGSVEPCNRKRASSPTLNHAETVMVAIFVSGDGTTNSTLGHNANEKCASQWQSPELLQQMYRKPNDHGHGHG